MKRDKNWICEGCGCEFWPSVEHECVGLAAVMRERARAEDAFRAGAEAMRKECATWALSREAHHPRWCAEQIRALPLPKETP